MLSNCWAVENVRKPYKFPYITNSYTSLSFRTPNIEPNQTDYEILLGIEFDFSQEQNALIEVLYERENGGYYKGHEVIFDSQKEDRLLSAILSKALVYHRKYRSFLREAADINIQTIDTSYILMRKIEIGYSLYFQNFANTDLMWFIQLKTNNIEWNMRFNAYRISTDLELYATISLYKNKNIYIKPLLVYNLEKEGTEKNEYFQAKILIGYKFGVTQ